MDDVSALTLVGGHPALDLVNTAERGLPVPGQPPGDALRVPADLATWAERVGLVDWSEVSLPTSLASVRTLREALHVVVLALVGETSWDDPVVGTALQRLDLSCRAASRRTSLVPPGDDGALGQRVGVPGPHLVEDRVAVAAAELLTSDLARRIRRCPVEQGGCGWVFLDRTKNHSRTWCRMADCGTQVKSRRLTERRRQQRRGGEPS